MSRPLDLDVSGQGPSIGQLLRTIKRGNSYLWPLVSWATLKRSVIEFYDKGQRDFWWNSSLAQREPLARWRLFPLNCYQGKAILSLTMKALRIWPVMNKGNSLSQIHGSRYQSADIIKQTLSDFEIRDLKMVDTVWILYRASIEGALRWSVWRRYKPFINAGIQELISYPRSTLFSIGLVMSWGLSLERSLIPHQSLWFRACFVNITFPSSWVCD